MGQAYILDRWNAQLTPKPPSQPNATLHACMCVNQKHEPSTLHLGGDCASRISLDLLVALGDLHEISVHDVLGWFLHVHWIEKARLEML